MTQICHGREKISRPEIGGSEGRLDFPA